MKIKKYIIISVVIILSNITFGQNDLSFYIDKAVRHNPLLIDLTNQKKLTNLNIQKTIKSLNSPTVSIQSNILFAPVLAFDNNQTKLLLNPNNPTDYLGYGIANSNGGQYQGLVNINKNILTIQKVNIYEQYNQELNKRIDNQVNLNKHLLEKQVTDQYLQLLNSQRLIIVTDSLFQLLTHQKEIIAQLAEKGLAQLADIKLIEIEIKNIELQKKNYKINFNTNLLLLNNLCGILDSTTQSVSELDIKVNINSKECNFTKQFGIDSTIAFYNQEINNLKYKPTLNLFANAGLSGVQFNQLPQRFGLSAGVGFNWVLYDGHQKSINEQAKLIQQETATYYKNNTALTIQNQKTSLLNRINTIDEQLNEYENQIKDYKVVLSLYQQSIQQGQISIINYTIVLKSILNIRINFYQLKTQKELLINEYNYWNW
jgi:hypothetical protein